MEIILFCETWHVESHQFVSKAKEINSVLPSATGASQQIK